MCYNTKVNLTWQENSDSLSITRKAQLRLWFSHTHKKKNLLIFIFHLYSWSTLRGSLHTPSCRLSTSLLHKHGYASFLDNCVQIQLFMKLVDWRKSTQWFFFSFFGQNNDSAIHVFFCFAKLLQQCLAGGGGELLRIILSESKVFALTHAGEWNKFLSRRAL